MPMTFLFSLTLCIYGCSYMYFTNKTSVRLSSCATITTRFQNFFLILQKNCIYISTATPYAPLLPALGNHWFTFCVYGFVYSGHFIQMESFSMWLSVPGFFCLAQYVPGSSTLWHISISRFLWLRNIPMWRYFTLGLFTISWWAFRLFPCFHFEE